MYDKNLLLHQVLKIVHFSVPIPNSEFVLCRMNINIPENFGNNTVIHTTLTHVWKSDIKFLVTERSNQALTLTTYCYLDYASYQNKGFRPVYGFFGVIAELNIRTKFSLDRISFPTKFSLDRISFPTPEVIFLQRNRILVRRKFLPEKII